MPGQGNDKRGIFWCPFHEAPHPAKMLWKIGDYHIVECCDSSLVYLANPLNNEELAKYYSLKYFEGDSKRKGYSSYTADEFILRKNFQYLLECLVEELRRSGNTAESLSLLEVGCAYGYFLDEARKYFGPVRGIEVNEEVARIGRERFGLTVDSSPEAIMSIERESLDVIAMWDVVEHLQRPRSVLASCAKGLRPGGLLCLTTGDIGSLLARTMGRRWRLINPPQHIAYFSRDTLTALLHECGFDVLDVRHRGRRVSFGFMLFILRYMLGGQRIQTNPRIDWFMRKSAYVNLFDVMMIVAERRR